MNKLEDLYIDEMLHLYKIEIAKSKLSDTFFDNYYYNKNPFLDLFKDTFKVFEVSNAIKTNSSPLTKFLEDFLSSDEISELLNLYKELVESNALELKNNKIIFTQNKSFYTNKTEKGFNIRSGQNISKFFIAYFNSIELDVNKQSQLNNQLDRLTQYIKADFEVCYLRIGIEPKDYFRMGQWGINENGYLHHSCTYISPKEENNIHNLFSNEDQYSRAIITYMQLPTFVATLYNNEDDAINREYKAISRQIYFYNSDISSLMGLRGYGHINDVQTIRENIAKIFSKYKQSNYKDYLLENRVEGKKKQNIFSRSLPSHLLSISRKYNLEKNDTQILGYLDTIHFTSYAKHTLIHALPQLTINDFIDLENENNDVLLSNESKEIKKATNELFKDFITLTEFDRSSYFIHPTLYPEIYEDEIIWQNKPLDEFNIRPFDFFLASKLLNETEAYTNDNYDDETAEYFRKLFIRNHYENEKSMIKEIFLTNEKIKLIESKINFKFSNLVEENDIINNNQIESER